MPGSEWLPEFFRQFRMSSHLFQGITDATMTHNEAWHFARLGRKLERADKTSRILDVKYFMLLPSLRDVGTPYDDIHWSAVLKSVSGFEMYRKKYGRISPRNIVEFLVMDREFPRSIHFCISRADESLHAITGTAAGTFQYLVGTADGAAARGSRFHSGGSNPRPAVSMNIWMGCRSR